MQAGWEYETTNKPKLNSMKQILRKCPCLWRFPDPFGLTFLLAFLLSFSANAQQTVSGKVTDETNTAMPGVNVILKNTTTGTTTDAEGAYSLTVPQGGDPVLVFSFIGYNTQEVAIGGRTAVDVSLTPNIQALQEVVVVGYGTLKKSDVTGSLVRVDEKALKEIPVANLAQSIQGRAAGVEINPTSARPGGGNQIRIRGSRSFTGSNDPLIVLDGIPFTGTINDINPNDIVSLDILKDASATAIYGSRGSNGVIIVTTRRGKAGKTQLFYDGYYGVSSVLDKYDINNGEEYLAFRNAARAAGASYNETNDELANIAAGKETDWQEETYKRGYITNHSIGAAGGTDKTKYLVSGGYFKQTTVLPGQKFTRYSLQASIDQEIGERIKLGLNTMNSMNIQDGEGASFMFQLLTLSPYYNARNPDGTIYELPATGSVDPNTRNPLMVYNEDSWKQQRRRLRTFNSVYGEVKIVEGLRYRLNLGLDLFQDNYGQYLGSNTPFVNGGTNTADVQNTNSWSYTAENLLLYDKTFNSVHKVGFTGLFSVQEEEVNRSASNANTLPADYMYYYNLGLGVTSSVPLNIPSGAANYYNRSGLVSYMGRINYSFSDRYLLTLTARADGSSRLAKGNKWFYYPAAAVAWNVHNEGFMGGLEFISNLKLRAGIGRTSNQAIDPYFSLGRLGGLDGRPAEPYNFGNTGTFGYLVTDLPNPILSWEFTTTTNVGLDFGLLSDRITGSLELYHSETEDILQRVSLPATSGVANVVQNVGSSENRGIELSLSSINIESQSSGFGWSTDFNFSINRNKITYLAGGVTRNVGLGWHVGNPIDAIYDYEKVGIVQTGETGLPAGFVPGEIKVKDQLTVDSDGDGVFDQADGVINGDDRIVLGSTQPKWSGGLTNRFTYKGFDLSVVMFWRVGGMLVSNLYQGNPSNPINSLEGRRNGPKVDFWTPENPTNKYPRPGIANSPDYGSTMGYFDATYMKIRTISLGYNLPESWLSKTGIGSLRLYAQVQNPFKAFFSDYVKEGGLDPETNGFGGANTEGFGLNGTSRLTVNANTPPTRSIIFGINLKY
jgi:TonB-dependent starch-binding outer membrane protein SusC